MWLKVIEYEQIYIYWNNITKNLFPKWGPKQFFDIVQ